MRILKFLCTCDDFGRKKSIMKWLRLVLFSLSLSSSFNVPEKYERANIFLFTRHLRLRCKVQISAFCATGGFRFPHHSHSCTPNTGRKSGIWLQNYLGCSQIALGGLNLKSDFQWARRKLSLWMWKTAFSFQTVYTVTLQHGSVGTFQIRPVPAHSGNPVIYGKRNNISSQSKQQQNPKYNYEPAKEQNEFPLYQIQRNPEKKIKRKETLIILWSTHDKIKYVEAFPDLFITYNK